jgi:hypothetical protein
MMIDDVPGAAAAREFKEALAGADMKPIFHRFLP